MKRNVSLEEISDGKLYDCNDMVKAGCDDCRGCSACCQRMGDSVLLDPLDIYRLTLHLRKSFEELLQTHIDLGVVDGIILPHLRMAGSEERCTFLDENGRCSIHPQRPGICRLFPLGRFYENGSFRYFLQTKECQKKNRTKVNVGKWIDTPQLQRNQQFINTWHYFLMDCEELLRQGDDSLAKNLNLYLLRRFFFAPYEEGRDFYDQFEERMRTALEELGLTEK